MTGAADRSALVAAADLFAALGDDGIPRWPWEIRFGAAGAGEQYVRLRSVCYRAAGCPEPPPA